MVAGILGDLKKIAYWYVLRPILPFLPLRAVHFIGDAAGHFNARFSRSMRDAVNRELALVAGVYTQRQRAAILRRGFRLMAKNRLEELLFRHWDRKRSQDFIRIHGWEKVESALSNGKGVILVIAHFGANKLVMPGFALRGRRINQIAGKPTEWIKIYGNALSPIGRKALGMEFRNEQYLPANFIYVFGTMRPVFERLKNNEIVCFAVDGGGGTKKRRIRFLGRDAMVSDGPFRIAGKTGARLLPAFVVRQPDNTHQIIIEEPIALDTGKGNGDGALKGLRQFMDLLEHYVHRYPCHYAYRLGLARTLCDKDPIPFFMDYGKGESSCD